MTLKSIEKHVVDIHFMNIFKTIKKNHFETFIIMSTLIIRLTRKYFEGYNYLIKRWQKKHRFN